MRKILILAIVYTMVLIFASGAANAYKSYATATGKVCGYCHVNPAGGGTLTAAGDYYLNNGTLPPEGPAAPTGLGASAFSSTQINLSWTDASTNETGFKVERSASASGPFTLLTTVGANVTTYNNTGLTASTPYYYRVCATNTAGDSAYATASATTLAPPVVIPATPTGLGASAFSSTQINLSWTDASSNETGFKVERSASASGPFTLITTVGANVTTYNNTGLTASTPYYYRVCATNTAGDSAYATASATTLAPPVVIPVAPTDLAASAFSSSQINLTWKDNSSDEIGFKVERASSADGTYTEIATPAAGETSYSDTGLPASTTFYYRVRAYSLSADSDYSNTASVATLTPEAPAAPTDLTASAVSATQINLSWTDASSNETGFKVERSASESGPFTLIATVGAGVTTYNNTGLTASTTYYYRVCATNDVGDSAYATASAATPAPPPVKPAAPTGLVASAVSVSQINLGWNDASTNETGFKVERSSSATGPFTLLTTVGAGVTTYSNTGLTASTPYYYRVCATNTAGDSAYATASAATLAPPVVIPAAPTGLAASAMSSSQINLSWTDASSNETGFKVERSASESGPFTLIATVGAGVTSYNNTGLTALTTYYYRVCATNTAGDSGYATASAATTAVPTNVRRPAAPSGLTASAVSSSRINLQWRDRSSNETGFIVQRSSTRSGRYSTIATLGAGVTSYANAGLTASTTYYYRVCSFNSAGSSNFSNRASATTQRRSSSDGEGSSEVDHSSIVRHAD